MFPLFAAFGAIGVAQAASTEREAAAPTDLKIKGVFDTDLPRTEWRDSLRVIFHPRAGDILRRDYLRSPIGLRYGITDRWEASGEVEGYMAHGLGDLGFASEAGFSSLRVSTKIRWNDWLRPFLETASGITYAAPIGTPPAEVTDGLKHLTPFITFQHEMAAVPGLSIFLGLYYDGVTVTHVRGRRRKNAFLDDAWGVTPGFVWLRGAFRYTCEVGIASTEWVSPASKTLVTVRPAVSWAVPKKFTGSNSGQWIAGLGMPVGFGPDGTDLGITFKFRGDFDLKRLLGLRGPETPDPDRNH